MIHNLHSSVLRKEAKKIRVTQDKTLLFSSDLLRKEMSKYERTKVWIFSSRSRCSANNPYIGVVVWIQLITRYFFTRNDAMKTTKGQ
jgi:hypothetical protein